jgi:hypothetical protein
MRNQTLIWTALPNGSPLSPNGLINGNYLSLSVFLSPRLTSDQDGPEPPLIAFPDFVNWPATIWTSPIKSPISFTVTFGSGQPIKAKINNVNLANNLLPDPTRWPLVFDEDSTAVRTVQVTDYSSLTAHTFDEVSTLSTIKGVYKSFALNSPLTPPVLFFDSNGNPTFVPANSGLQASLGTISAGSSDSPSPITQAVKYYQRPAPPPFDETPWKASLPTLDFHQGVAMLGSYPTLLRLFGLVFDLLVPWPGNFKSGTSTVTVTPTWTSHFTGASNQTTVNVSPPTACMLVPQPGTNVLNFLPLPIGGVQSEDYNNGMLDLADTSRFSVTELDVDGAAQQMNVLSSVLKSVTDYEGELDGQSEGQTMSLAVPNLRSVGPAVIRSGWKDQLQALTARQTSFQEALTNHFVGGGPLPTFHAEDIIRGHRFDIYTTSEPTPAWRSLLARNGRYSFGVGAGPSATSANLPMSVTDEGAVVPGVSQAAGIIFPPSDIYVHEEIMRWSGWSLAAPRVGDRLGSTAPGDTNDLPEAPNHNPAAPISLNGQKGTNQYGHSSPQMSATFSVPFGSLPKLRYGSNYRVRARGVDLAGNGPALSSTDASHAQSFTHYRYHPVQPPMAIPTEELTPGQSVLLAALLDWCDGSPVQDVGRWLFPARVSELLAEEHGMFDGFVLGQPPNPADGPDPSQNTYNFITQADLGDIAGVNGVRTDPTSNSPYIRTDPRNPYVNPPLTTWLPDPLSRGLAFTGLPGLTDGEETELHWNQELWPTYQPILFVLEAGATAGNLVTSPFGSGGNMAVYATLPPASVYNVHISSLLTINFQTTLGVWQWILEAIAGEPPAIINEFTGKAMSGQVWMLTPYITLRIAHAVRLPNNAPVFGNPIVHQRDYASTKATIFDEQFAVDGASTASIDVQATWQDPVDDPSDPNNDPTTAFVTTTANAFKLSVPDPNPPAAIDHPGKVLPAPVPFELFTPGAVHDIGDTKYHSISYQATGQSRFAEFFRSSPPEPFVVDTSTIPLSPVYGLDPFSLIVIDVRSGDRVADTEYTVDPVGGTVAFNANSSVQGQTVTISWIPTVTRQGPATPVAVLSSARPKPPKIVRVLPSWQIINQVVGNGTTEFQRTGNFLRVYLDRPWWSTGANELLGVVTADPSLLGPAPLPDPQARLVTLMGLDPISLADPSLSFPTSPATLGGTVQLPANGYVPGRNNTYTNPASLNLTEDPNVNNLYRIWPYEVAYDSNYGQWYADIQLTFADDNQPPPGYFVKLALVRFQPFSEPGAECSTVSLATFAQPVPNRTVTLVPDPVTNRALVTVTGPGYQGFRPATESGGAEVPPFNFQTPLPSPAPAGEVTDIDNSFAPDFYSKPLTPGAAVTSTMVLEVQVRNANLISAGVPEGDLTWLTEPGGTPVVMQSFFEANGMVKWFGIIDLPVPLGTEVPGQQRVRVSEIDYYTGEGAPSQVDTTLRRPFICHIPV